MGKTDNKQKSSDDTWTPRVWQDLEPQVTGIVADLAWEMVRETVEEAHSSGERLGCCIVRQKGVEKEPVLPQNRRG
jgi:hypothetical protein